MNEEWRAIAGTHGEYWAGHSKTSHGYIWRYKDGE